MGPAEQEPGAAVAIVHTRGPEESILLIRRALRAEDPWSGQWSFPGGHRDRQDRDLLDTALRELAEECDVHLTRADLTQALPHAWAGRRVGRFVLVAPFVFAVHEPLAIHLDLKEAVEALWAPVRLLRDPSLHSIQSVPGLPAGRRFPGIDLNGVPLWGFTYRVVCQWIGAETLPEE